MCCRCKFLPDLNKVEWNGCRNFLGKVQSSFMTLNFYILLQVCEMVNNSNSEIMRTYFISHNLDVSTVLMLNLPFLLDPPLLIYVHITGNAWWRERHTAQMLAGQGRKSTYITHPLCVRHLAEHKSYPISDLTVAVAPPESRQEVK